MFKWLVVLGSVVGVFVVLAATLWGLTGLGHFEGSEHFYE